jgi:hypothetical protein
MNTLYETLEAKLKEKFGKYTYELDDKVQRAIDAIADILIAELEERDSQYGSGTMIRRIALFLFDNIPLGFLAPYVFGIIIGSKPKRKE